ncbi:hypothetical protein H9N25_13680 [Pedobacter riviphilus]|uniref:Uncharacterized protein n=1 Tax=Pedobacter riviphilus TaxID=2766984 RepID=A0ABX6TCJ7_9SPHI|nr:MULTISPECIES: hypothetical protein [Pedobacter]NII83873.1 hypothetical protein [Pedobacter sp. SG908]NMN37747.1 hypothetical protein [Pedobacter sp. SG918]QNR83027.1 hypothetical protein H9N25_13680 [Pedobacter riviphilus]
MKTLLNELRLIEHYLLSDAKDGESFLFEAKMILQPELREQVYWQNKTYQVVRDYSRKQLKNEINNIHETLFNTVEHQSFRQKVMRLFHK